MMVYSFIYKWKNDTRVVLWSKELNEGQMEVLFKMERDIKKSFTGRTKIVKHNEVSDIPLYYRNNKNRGFNVHYFEVTRENYIHRILMLFEIDGKFVKGASDIVYNVFVADPHLSEVSMKILCSASNLDICIDLINEYLETISVDKLSDNDILNLSVYKQTQLSDRDFEFIIVEKTLNKLL